MASPKTLTEAAGRWRGRSRLYLPWLPPEEQITESDSELVIEVGPRETYATVAYTWHYDGEQQAGSMVLAQSKKGNVTCGWADSWHQHGDVLLSEGPAGEVVRVTGLYGSGEVEPKWGWRTEFERTGPDSLVMRMINISPEGKEEWAVDAVYARVSPEA